MMTFQMEWADFPSHIYLTEIKIHSFSNYWPQAIRAENQSDLILSGITD